MCCALKNMLSMNIFRFHHIYERTWFGIRKTKLKLEILLKLFLHSALLPEQV
jgi:hypothetical protein